MAKRYFSVKDHRGLSFNYYHDLLKAALKGDAIEAERLCKTTLEKSLARKIEKIKKAGGVINETKIF